MFYRKNKQIFNDTFGISYLENGIIQKKNYQKLFVLKEILNKYENEDEKNIKYIPMTNIEEPNNINNID